MNYRYHFNSLTGHHSQDHSSWLSHKDNYHSYFEIGENKSIHSAVHKVYMIYLLSYTGCSSSVPQAEAHFFTIKGKMP